MKKHIIYILLGLIIAMFYSCSEDTIDGTQTGSISGTVIEQGSNEPIENVKLTIVSSNASVLSDENGNFVIDNILVGEQSVSADKEGYLASFEAIAILADQTSDIIVEMSISTANNRSPEEPTLITPIDNATDLDVNVELTWSSIDPDGDDLVYTVELRNDQNSDVIMYEDITEEVLLLEDLNYGVGYFWQVSASDGINPEVWSLSQSFHITGDPEHRFLFTRKMNGNEVIFSAGFNEANDVVELQLTSSGNNSWRPRKNTSNNLIAFLRNEGSGVHIFSMNPDGSDLLQITGSVAVNGFDLEQMDFCWNKTGSRLYYTSFDKLYVINKDGSGLTLLYQTPDGSFISECDITDDETMMALKTNNINGYEVSIFTIDMSGTVLTTILSGVNGAAGGLNFSVDNNRLLYTHDISGFESADYRQLDTHIFMYDFGTTTVTDLSANKPTGFLDLDPRFSPNEAEVIYSHTSNDGLSESVIQKLPLVGSNRDELFTDAKMPDWE